MNIFQTGNVVLEERIDGERWVFKVSKVFYLSDEEYSRNEAYNDTLGNYEPAKELPTNSFATITASNNSGGYIEFHWSSGIGKIYPHVSKKGWSKGLFVKLNQILSKWRFPNA